MSLSSEDRALIKAALILAGHRSQAAADIAADPSDYALDEDDLTQIIDAVRAEERARITPKASSPEERDAVEDWASLEAAFKWAFAKGAGTFLQDPLGETEWKIYRSCLDRSTPVQDKGSEG